jgi:hypothetical protein
VADRLFEWLLFAIPKLFSARLTVNWVALFTIPKFFAARLTRFDMDTAQRKQYAMWRTSKLREQFFSLPAPHFPQVGGGCWGWRLPK